MIKWYSKGKALTQGTLFLLHDKKQENAETRRGKKGQQFGLYVGARDKDRLPLFSDDGTAKAWERGHWLLRAGLRGFT